MATGFYLRGLGKILQSYRPTPSERAFLTWLCSAAAESDATYWDAVHGIEPGSELDRVRESLKSNLRRCGLQPLLEGHYAQAA